MKPKTTRIPRPVSAPTALAIALACVFAASGSAHARSIATAGATGDGCEDRDGGTSGSSSAFASCIGFARNEAGAEAGRVRVFSSATATRTADGSLVDASGTASANSSFSDILTFDGIDDGVFTLPLSFTGSVDVATILTGPSPGVQNAQAGIAARILSGTGGNGEFITFGYSIQYTELPNTTGLTITESGAQNGSGTIDVPIVDGLGFLSYGLEASAVSGGVSQGSSSTVTIDYGNSLRIIGGTVFDSEGNLIDDVSVTGASGFDYIAGFNPSAVPLPPAVWLLASGLVSAGLLGRRRRARSA